MPRDRAASIAPAGRDEKRERPDAAGVPGPNLLLITVPCPEPHRAPVRVVRIRCLADIEFRSFGRSIR